VTYWPTPGPLPGEPGTPYIVSAGISMMPTPLQTQSMADWARAQRCDHALLLILFRHCSRMMK